MNVILVEKGEELYAFYYDDGTSSAALLLETVVRFAADPQLSFGWDDAVGVSDAQQGLDVARQTLRNVTGTE